MVSQELIQELQQIIEGQYGKKIGLEEASNIANDMVAYFDLLAKINYRLANDIEI